METPKVIQLWDGGSDDVQPLRKPNTTTNQAKENSNTTQQKVNTTHQIVESGPDDAKSVDLDILNTSSLSVDAKEWFPANYGQIEENFEELGLSDEIDEGKSYLLSILLRFLSVFIEICNGSLLYI